MTYTQESFTGSRQQDSEETITIFRKWKDSGDIIALFPGLNYDTDACLWGRVMSYMHTGQHSEADYKGVISQTTPAKEEEYEDLANELESIGYRLCVVRKKPLGL